MTSAITLDDVESALWQAGIRRAATIDSILRLVRLYRMAAVVPRVPPEPPPPVRIGPGESDPATRTSRCAKCLRIKSWNQFLTGTDQADTCRSCVKITGIPDDAIFTCSSCGRGKHASHFYRRGDLASGYSGKCKDCHDGKSTCAGCGVRWETIHLEDGKCPPCRTGRDAPAGKYLCRKCGCRKILGDFPAGKRAHPPRSSWCTECARLYGGQERVPQRKCPGCGKRKPAASYPEGSARCPGCQP